MEPGILFTERPFGLLELHSRDADELVSAGKAILDGTGMVSSSAMKPEILFQHIIQDIADQHAILLTETEVPQWLFPGSLSLLIEMVPALFVCLAANEAEKVSPAITLVDVQMMGASGRVLIAGRSDELEICLSAIESALN
ncbi:hypothetical protein [Grimontia marina]|uniref:Uncharacterized protein n=1 Tax=Grimontia marina TaxID=646534 RepID=A0A128FD47_9GAMM|nr:hypothetical protein [Grimontia marina]CZF84719.1 hypothetical protein GMA8713_03221 [Grimontia marina]